MIAANSRQQCVEPSNSCWHDHRPLFTKSPWSQNCFVHDRGEWLVP
jgi:hypothetical protein